MLRNAAWSLSFTSTTECKVQSVPGYDNKDLESVTHGRVDSEAVSILIFRTLLYHIIKKCWLAFVFVVTVSFEHSSYRKQPLNSDARIDKSRVSQPRDLDLH